jgi:hypothetical protein
MKSVDTIRFGRIDLHLLTGVDRRNTGRKMNADLLNSSRIRILFREKALRMVAELNQPAMKVGAICLPGPIIADDRAWHAKQLQLIEERSLTQQKKFSRSFGGLCCYGRRDWENAIKNSPVNRRRLFDRRRTALLALSRAPHSS